MKIKWTLKSRNDYWQNIEYLENYRSEKTILNFIFEVKNTLDLLEKGNVIFIESDYPEVFKIVIIKQITLYYSIKNGTIYLLRFWNNYQDLSNFKLK